MRFLHKKWWFSVSTLRLHHHVLVPFHHGLPQNMGTNSFFHSWLSQSVPTFAVYPPCDDPHILAWRDTCHFRTQLRDEPCQVVKQNSSS